MLAYLKIYLKDRKEPDDTVKGSFEKTILDKQEIYVSRYSSSCRESIVNSIDEFVNSITQISKSLPKFTTDRIIKIKLILDLESPDYVINFANSLLNSPWKQSPEKKRVFFMDEFRYFRKQEASLFLYFTQKMKASSYGLSVFDAIKKNPSKSEVIKAMLNYPITDYRINLFTCFGMFINKDYLKSTVPNYYNGIASFSEQLAESTRLSSFINFCKIYNIDPFNLGTKYSNPITNYGTLFYLFHNGGKIPSTQFSEYKNEFEHLRKSLVGDYSNLLEEEDYGDDDFDYDLEEDEDDMEAL